jgi:uncharacterized linocin/CFP29 family protein
MERLITRQSEELRDVIDKIACSRMELKEIESLYTPLLSNDRYYTGEQIQREFSICKKTLQLYRDKGIVAYTSIGGKFLYKESDILKILKDNYRPARKPFEF